MHTSGSRPQSIPRRRGRSGADLKPSNIMLVADSAMPSGERVKLLDFGVAKLAIALHAAESQVRTHSGQTLGTPQYMSPEQCRDVSQVDGMTDVYALGVILYQMLSGQVPFLSSGEFAIAAMHLYEPPPPLQSRTPQVNELTAELVHRMLAKSKEERPTMAQVLTVLQTMGINVTASTQKASAISLGGQSGSISMADIQAAERLGTLGELSGGATTEAAPKAAGRKAPVAKKQGKAPADRPAVTELRVMLTAALRGTDPISLAEHATEERRRDAALTRSERALTTPKREKPGLEAGSPDRVVVLWTEDAARADALRATLGVRGLKAVREAPGEPGGWTGASAIDLSMVFTPPSHQVDLRNWGEWWRFTKGADWRHPQGPKSNINNLDSHPVVHVAYSDALAYAKWAGKDLPTEAEWEYAARGGLDGAEYAWGDEFTPAGKHMANTWQGEFPRQNLTTDGYERTSPVTAFPPNGYGVHDMIGNVWEWTTDWYSARHVADEPEDCCKPSNPRGGSEEGSYDPQQPQIRIPRKVIKGGSHLCAPEYCHRYRPAARSPQARDTATTHIGFRCVDSAVS